MLHAGCRYSKTPPLCGIGEHNLVEQEDVDLTLISTESTIRGELLPYARNLLTLADAANQVARP